MWDSPFSCESTTCLDVPRVRCDGVEREALGDLHRRHGSLHVLFVGQNENRCILQVLKKKKRERENICQRLPMVH